jgi:hypothetical protein
MREAYVAERAAATLRAGLLLAAFAALPPIARAQGSTEGNAQAPAQEPEAPLASPSRPHGRLTGVVPSGTTLRFVYTGHPNDLPGLAKLRARKLLLDPQQRFEIPPLPRGRYAVAAFRNAQQVSGRKVFELPSKNWQLLKLYCHGRTTLRIVTQDSLGRPVEHSKIRITQDLPNWAQTMHTPPYYELQSDRQGKASRELSAGFATTLLIENPLHGKARVELPAEQPWPEPVIVKLIKTPPQDRAPQTEPERKRYTVRGTVLRKGKPFEGARVFAHAPGWVREMRHATAYLALPTPLARSTGHDRFVGPDCTTDANGRFELRVWVPGPVIVRARAYPDAASSEGQRVEVGEEPQNIAIQLGTASARGEIPSWPKYNEKRRPTLLLFHADEASLRPGRGQGGRHQSPVSSGLRSIKVRRDGSFRLEGLSPGTWILRLLVRSEIPGPRGFRREEEWRNRVFRIRQDQSVDLGKLVFLEGNPRALRVHANLRVAHGGRLRRVRLYRLHPELALPLYLRTLELPLKEREALHIPLTPGRYALDAPPRWQMERTTEHFSEFTIDARGNCSPEWIGR